LNLPEELAGLNSIFLDTAPIIYYIEAHPEYGPLMKKIVASVQSGELYASTSVITITEVLPKPVAQNQGDLVDTFLKFLKKGARLDLIDISPEIAESAGRLKANYGSLKTMDALQISAAIESGAEAFLTNDIRLKQIQETKIIVLNDYL
jgi:predicted nucleic acid-binding protein